MIRADFSWSLSRHETFQRCRRRYFYSYYASAEDPEIYRLKKLSALPLWAGSVVHEAIESFLRDNDRLPSPEAREALVRDVVHRRMLAEWRESEAGPEGFRLFEHEYDVSVGHDDKKRLVGIVMRSLRNFFRSETLAEAFAAGRERWLSLEELIEFEIAEVPVRLRMDLAYRRDDGRVVIVDWKTGRGEGRFSEVQVAGYALYAAEHGWVETPEELETELAYLALPRYVRRRVKPSGLRSARSFMERSARRMREALAEPETGGARIEDFPMIDRPSVCRRCNFRRLCFPPRAVRPEASAAPPPP